MANLKATFEDLRTAAKNTIAAIDGPSNSLRGAADALQQTDDALAGQIRGQWAVQCRWARQTL